MSGVAVLETDLVREEPVDGRSKQEIVLPEALPEGWTKELVKACIKASLVEIQLPMLKGKDEVRTDIRQGYFVEVENGDRGTEVIIRLTTYEECRFVLSSKPSFIKDGDWDLVYFHYDECYVGDVKYGHGIVSIYFNPKP